jgi:hypothetical protein
VGGEPATPLVPKASHSPGEGCVGVAPAVRLVRRESVCLGPLAFHALGAYLGRNGCCHSIAEDALDSACKTPAQGEASPPSSTCERSP